MNDNGQMLRWGGAAALLVSVAIAVWFAVRPQGPPEGIAAGNGRMEAVEIDIAAKLPGHIREILVNEGDLVKAGQVVAHMDMATLLAQKAESKPSSSRR